MQFLKITIFIFLFLCTSFSLSEGFCEKSIESFSGPKGQFNHFFRNNFISKAVRNRLQEKHDERELKASVREWEQLREGRFKAEREAIELKITQAEQQLDSEELKLEKSRSERLQARYGIKGKYSAEQVRSNWESRLA